jgi:hypothetical protein
MFSGGEHRHSAATSRRLSRRPAILALALAACLSGALPAWAGGPRARSAEHFACSKPNSAKLPCYFSTPSDNIRCEWTPAAQAVACELLATGRAYRLHPTGKAKSVKLKLHRRGETLPTNQLIVFPQSLSCRDTKTTMTCNQDFLLGFFKLAVKGSRSR